MKPYILKIKVFFFMLAAVIVSVVVLAPARAQNDQADAVQVADDNAGAETPKAIILTESKEPLEDRLQRKITLDVRDMNIVDVIKFLAQKGEFNVVISPRM